jgi:hypothetical protein
LIFGILPLIKIGTLAIEKKVSIWKDSYEGKKKIKEKEKKSTKFAENTLQKKQDDITQFLSFIFLPFVFQRNPESSMIFVPTLGRR